MISEVVYKEIDPKLCNPIETGEFYYYYNLLGMNNDIDRGYEDYEKKQLNIRNSIIKEMIQNNEIPRHPKIDTTIIGLSSLRDNVIIIVEY